MGGDRKVGALVLRWSPSDAKYIHGFVKGWSTQAAAAGLPAYLAEAAGHWVLVHLDGRGLSSSLERYLALGSVVLAEQSGYYGYFHKALQPYKHHLPWWEAGGPGDISERMAWVAANPDRGAAIAAAGRDFARSLLTAQGRACYWLRLLRRLATSLSYQLDLQSHPPCRCGSSETGS